MNAPVEFVYFDLGNVLLAFDPNLACQNVANRFGVSTESAHLVIYDSGLQESFESGLLSSDEFARRVRLGFGMGVDEMPTGSLLDALSDMFVPVETMADALNAVRSNGFGVGLLSNTCESHWDWILRQRYEATRFTFDATILSFEVGSMKPDERIYEAAEQACGVAVDRILFLDDRDENVLGAKRRNWKTVGISGPSDSWGGLREHGLVE